MAFSQNRVTWTLGMVALALAGSFHHAWACGENNAPVIGATGTALPSDTVLACVDGAVITQRDVDRAAADIGANLPALLKGKARQAYVLDYLINAKLVIREAERDGVDRTQGFAHKLAYAQQKLLDEAVLAGVAEKGTSAEALQRLYNEAVQAKAQKASAKPLPPFEAIKPQLQRFAVQRAQADLIRDLRSHSKIEIFGASARPIAP